MSSEVEYLCKYIQMMNPMWVQIILLIAALIMPIGGVSNAAEYNPNYIEGAGVVCVERLEDEGLRNIEELHLLIENHIEIGFVGGIAACAYLPPGQYNLSLSSSGFKPRSRPVIYGSIPLVVRRNQMIELEVCSNTDVSGKWRLVMKHGDHQCGATGN